MLGSLVTIGVISASTLSNIHLSSTQYSATVLLRFNGPPNYVFFSLSSPERVVLDIKQNSKISYLPVNFSGKSLLTRIRSSTSKDNHSVRLIFDLTRRAKISTAIRHHGSAYILVFNLIDAANDNVSILGKVLTSARVTSSKRELVHRVLKRTRDLTKKSSMIVGPAVRVMSRSSRISTIRGDRVVVAIDAGHGGQDPGAIGLNGLKEKNVTIAVARRLHMLLNYDSQFKPVLTRNGDYFISVTGRSDVARKRGANVLVSIHADAAPNRSANGASVWVLSNRRADSEMAAWLEQYDKQPELLGGAGDMLANSQTDPYLSQAVLALQFGYSQRVGYDVALQVLQQLQNVGALHKRRPEHASIGVLRSPDIPSLLVETGFISNSKEERLLGSSAYQDKIAGAIYNGLRNYFLVHPLQVSPKVPNRPLGIVAAVKFLI